MAQMLICPSLLVDGCIDRVASKLSQLSQLAVLFLVALGWKVTRNQLSAREVRLLLAAFGLYVCLSSSLAACPDSDVEKNKLCETYRITEYVMHSVILLGKYIWRRLMARGDVLIGAYWV